MKRKPFYAITAVLLLTVLLFAGCGKQDGKGAEPTTEEITTTAPGTSTAAPAAETSAVPASSETQTAETTQTTSPTTEAAKTTVKPTAKATTTAAPATKPEASVDVNAVAAAVASRAGLFEEQLFPGSASRALALFGIDSSRVSECAYYVASAAVAEEILVVKAADADSVSAIRSGMENRRASQIEEYADYVPKEVPKLENAVIYQDGNYVVFCVSNDSSAARSAIAGQF